LHWVPFDRSQFSFDRVNDDDSHHKNNCRVTCLDCNLKRAEKQYGLNAKNAAKLAEYKRYQKLFFKDTKNTVIRLHLANLHDHIFEDRKPNNWLRAGETLTKDCFQGNIEDNFYE
jgi:hypothetical protein